MAQDQNIPELERDRDPMDEDKVVGYDEGEEFEDSEESDEEAEESDEENF